MGTYGGGSGSVDSSGWDRPVATHKNGEPHPGAAPHQQTDRGMERTPTPDPYTDNNSDVKRSFGRS